MSTVSRTITLLRQAPEYGCSRFKLNRFLTNEAWMATHRSMSFVRETDSAAACLLTLTLGCLGLQVFTSHLGLEVEPRTVHTTHLAGASSYTYLANVAGPVAVWLGNGTWGVVSPDALNTLVTWGRPAVGRVDEQQ